MAAAAVKIDGRTIRLECACRTVKTDGTGLLGREVKRQRDDRSISRFQITKIDSCDVREEVRSPDCRSR